MSELNKDELKIKYRSRPLMAFFCLALSALMAMGTFFLLSDSQGILVSILSILFTLLILFGAIMQFVLPRKDFHVLVNKKAKELIIDMGIKKKKRIDLSQVKGISYQTQQVKGTTFYVVQLSTTPNYWGEFYHKKNAKIELYDLEYETMYITLSISNQKDQDIEALFQYLIEMNLKKVAFQPSVLGSYPGVFKKNSGNEELNKINTPLKKKLKIKQWMSYFLIRTVLMITLFYFIIHFMGISRGIFW